MSNKPYAKSLKSKPISEDKSVLKLKSLDSEKHHIQNQTDRMDNDHPSRRQQLDSLTLSLGCTSYYIKMRWAWFTHCPYGVTLPLEVSRFYQEKKLALDIGVNQTDIMVAEKKKLLESNGVKYYVIKDVKDLEQFSKGTL